MSIRTRKYIAYSILAIVFASCANKKEIIAKKWPVKETIVSGQSLSGDMVSGFYLELNTNGNYTLSGMQTEKGTWQLSSNQDSLITVNEENRKAAYYIIELNKNKLVLYDNSLGTETQTIFGD